MKFIKMLPPACESGAFDEDVRQPIMMLMSLMEVLVLEELESLTRRVDSHGPDGGIGVSIGSPDGRVAEGVCRD